MQDYHKFLSKCDEDCASIESSGRPFPTCCRAQQLRLIELAFDLLPKYNLTWFITQGNLLGCVRHGGQVFHDTDVDIAILLEHEKDDSNFQEFRKEFDPLTSFRGSEHLDFYFLAPIEGQPQLVAYHQDWFMKEEMIFSAYPKKETFEEGAHFPIVWNQTDLFPVSTCLFFDREVPCPKESVKVVQRMYGSGPLGSVCNIVRKWCNWTKNKSSYEDRGKCSYENQKREKEGMRKSQLCLAKNGYPYLDCTYDDNNGIIF